MPARVYPPTPSVIGERVGLYLDVNAGAGLVDDNIAQRVTRAQLFDRGAFCVHHAKKTVQRRQLEGHPLAGWNIDH